MENNVHLLSIPDEYSAIRYLKKIGVAPQGIELMSPKCVHHCIQVEGVDKRAANILKQEMLALGGETAIPWSAFMLSSEVCNVILIGTRKQFLLLIKKLNRQPFGLKSVGTQINEVLENYQKTEFCFKARENTLRLGNRTLIMGVLNATPDSFSRDGIYKKPQKAIDYAMKMLDQGADLIDVGGESTRPGANVTSAEEELNRVLPIIKGLRKMTSALISVDTYKHQVARQALEEGADIINDVTGTNYDPDILPIIKDYGAGLVIMHSPNPPEIMHQPHHYDNLISEIISHLRKVIAKASAAGVSQERIIIDPGIGFGKTVSQNFIILKNLESFKSLGRPILIGTSRKSFIGKTLNQSVDERLFGTCTTVAAAIFNGAQIIRVHDPAVIKDVAIIADTINNAGVEV